MNPVLFLAKKKNGIKIRECLFHLWGEGHVIWEIDGVLIGGLLMFGNILVVGLSDVTWHYIFLP